MKIVIDAIYGDKFKNEMMRCCDVFPESKKLVEFQKMEITGNNINTSKFLEHLKTSLEKAKYEVVFLGIRSIDDLINNEILPYIKEGINTISSGRNFILFGEFLKKLGYKVKMNKYKEVLHAQLE